MLAYSTISQLGYMFLAVGVGAYGAAIFHMITHAFFKALLFLGAGSVIHGMDDEQDMRRMGGLRKFMPVTAGTFIVGWLAIAGVIPFAGFWSKDEILAKAWFHHDYALWAVGVVAAVLTAFYMTRQVWLVFFGAERWREPAPEAATGAEADAHADEVHGGSHGGGHEPHESPWIMTMPLVVLAALAFAGGVIDLPFDNSKLNLLDRWLAPVLHGAPEITATSFGAGLALSTVALVVAVVGIVVGRAVYRNGLDAARRRSGRRAPRWLRQGAGQRVLPRRRPRSVRERPDHVRGALPQRGHRPRTSSTAPSTASAAGFRACGRRVAQGADRAGAQLRARDRARRGARARVRHDEGQPVTALLAPRLPRTCPSRRSRCSPR